MSSPGMYNLSVEHLEGYRRPARLGLLRDRTGIPVFLLYLQGAASPGRFEMHSAEEVEMQIFNARLEWDKAAWRNLLPFFNSEGSTAQVVTLSLSPSPSDLLGQMVGYDRGLNNRTGIHALRNCIDCADIVVIPQASHVLDAETHRLFYRTLVDTLSPLQHFFFIIDLPKTFTTAQAMEWMRGITFADAAIYFPWLLSAGELTPPGPLVAAGFQKNDERFGINQIPANRAIKSRCQPLFNLTPAQMQHCLENRLNLIQNFGPDDLRLWGGRTLADPMDWEGRFISNRRAVTALRETVHELCEAFVLEPMAPDLPHMVDVTLHSALSRMGKLFDPDAKQPFTTNIRIATQSTEEVLEIEVAFALPYALDQMSFSLGLTG